PDSGQHPADRADAHGRARQLTRGPPGGEAEAEEPVELEMPTEGSFQADDGQRVTGWQPTEGLAMRPVTLS
ncbi:hypothetical protein ABZ476_14635, partial [Streptomyces albogriseolus]|uniref:hypothetical protein n=1 Tax=Streptomyces albogriseolus TaxID=1887 RepID=UPI00346143FA